MPGPRHRNRLILLLVVFVTLTGCQREERVNRDAPNGPYYERLDSGGKRVVIFERSGAPVLKLRRYTRRTKVYSPETMTVLGTVSRTERGLSVGRIGQEETPVKSGPDSMEVPRRLSLERVTDGWAVLDAEGTTLGYLARAGDEEWTLRDDYSSEPRLRAKREDGRLVVRDEDNIVFYSYDPLLSAPEILALTLEGLDPLSRATLARWLAQRQSES